MLKQLKNLVFDRVGQHSNSRPASITQLLQVAVLQCQQKQGASSSKKLVFKLFGDSGSLASKVDWFGRHVSWFILPIKGMSILLSWGRLMPLSEGMLAVIAKQQRTIKVVNSTFELSKFVVKQIKLFKAFEAFRDERERCNQLSFNLAVKTKNVFTAVLEVTASTLKIALLFDKTHLVNLSKISTELPASLSHGTHLLSLGMRWIKFSESTWELGKLIKEGQIKDVKNLSRKEISSIARVGSDSIKLFSSALSSGMLFLGWCVSPVLLTTISTVSFTASLINKIFREKSMQRSKGATGLIEAATSLPA